MRSRALNPNPVPKLLGWFLIRGQKEKDVDKNSTTKALQPIHTTSHLNPTPWVLPRHKLSILGVILRAIYIPIIFIVIIQLLVRGAVRNLNPEQSIRSLLVRRPESGSSLRFAPHTRKSYLRGSNNKGTLEPQHPKLDPILGVGVTKTPL